MLIIVLTQNRTFLTATPAPQMASGTVQSHSNAFRTLSSVVKKAMRDKVANVYLSSLSTFQATIDGFAESVGSRDIQVCLRTTLVQNVPACRMKAFQICTCFGAPQS